MKGTVLKIVAIIGVILVSACKNEVKKVYSKDEIAKESVKLNTFFQKQFDEYLDRHPVNQTYLGITKNADKWNDISDEFKNKELALTKKALQWMLDSVNVDALDADTKLSYDLAKQKYENTIADMCSDYYRLRLSSHQESANSKIRFRQATMKLLKI